MSGLGQHIEYAQNFIAQVDAQHARDVARESAMSSDKTRKNTERLYLVVQAMWELLKGKAGLTDTDLDVDPDAEVEVTEVADDQPTTQEAAAWEGMVEGKDYFVEYEDASILQLEAGAGDMMKKFGNAIKALWDKILTFVRSVIVKINDALGVDKKFLDKNKDAIVKGLTSDAAEVSAKVGKLATASVSTTEDASVEITPWGKVLATVSGLSGDFSKAIQSDDERAKLQEKITSIKTGAGDAAKVEKNAEKVKINGVEVTVDNLYVSGGEGTDVGKYPVVLNSDNMTVSDTNVVREFEFLKETTGISDEEKRILRRNAEEGHL